MVMAATDDPLRSLCILKETLIAAPIEIAFEAVLKELGPASEEPGGKPMPMVIEPWPGGRWYRDLGNHAGHLWGHVQVIKPPMLLEICGSMFMSYACVNHLQYRLIAEGDGTRLKLTHRAVGQISAEHQAGVTEGWSHALNLIRHIAETRCKSK